MIPSGIIEWAAISVCTLSVVWVTLGFFRPDPYALERWPLLSRVFLWACRILIPAGAAALLWLVLQIRKGKITVANAAVFFLTSLFLLLLLYPVADLRYHRAMAKRHNQYKAHPFLQLTPAAQAARLGQPGDSYRIFCLGGSTTEFADSSGRDWPSRVEENLKKRLGRSDIQVLNFGRQWYTTLHMLILYETNLRPYHPDAVILMETINDLLVNVDFSTFSGGPFRPDYGHFYGPLTRVFNHKGLIPATAEFLGHYWYFTPRTVVEQDSFPGLPSFKRNLNTLIDLARMDGTQVVLMTQPNLYSDSISTAGRRSLRMLNQEAIGPDKQWSYQTALNGFRQYREALLKIAAERGVIAIDLESAIPKTLEYFYDDVHYQNRSFDLVAGAVTEGLIKGKVVSEKKR
jgi:lysophospholipase L1-like esterase